MSDQDAAGLALFLAMYTNAGVVLFLSHRRREASVHRILGATLPGFVIIFGIFAYFEVGFTLTKLFWVSILILFGAAASIVVFMQFRKFVREVFPAEKAIHKDYWKKRILAEQADGNIPLTLQRGGRLPKNEELFSYGFDEPELRELGLLD